MHEKQQKINKTVFIWQIFYYNKTVIIWKNVKKQSYNSGVRIKRRGSKEVDFIDIVLQAFVIYNGIIGMAATLIMAIIILILIRTVKKVLKKLHSLMLFFI